MPLTATTLGSIQTRGSIAADQLRAQAHAQHDDVPSGGQLIAPNVMPLLHRVRTTKTHLDWHPRSRASTWRRRWPCVMPMHVLAVAFAPASTVTCSMPTVLAPVTSRMSLDTRGVFDASRLLEYGSAVARTSG
jgi:hypothetical protein